MKGKLTSECSVNKIPTHLKQDYRPTFRIFNKEHLYFRVPSVSETARENIPKGSIRHITDNSVNRSFLCVTPQDTLINHRDGELYTEYDLAFCPVYKCEDFEKIHEHEGWRYTIRVIHDPICCNYPHSEIRIFKDGVRQVSGEVSSKNIKRGIRTHISKRFKLIKNNHTERHQA